MTKIKTIDDPKSTEKNEVTGSILDIFIIIFSSANRTNFLVAMWLWTMNQLMYYNTLLNLEKFKDDFENAPRIFFISYIISNLVAGVFANNFNRKTLIIVGSVCTWVSILFIYYIKYFSINNAVLKYFSFAFFNIVFCFTGSISYIYIPELFPSNIKNTCVSYAKIPARLLLIITPFLFDSVNVMYFVYFVMNFVIPALLYFTPETKEDDK